MISVCACGFFLNVRGHNLRFPRLICFLLLWGLGRMAKGETLYIVTYRQLQIFRAPVMYTHTSAGGFR